MIDATAIQKLLDAGASKPQCQKVFEDHEIRQILVVGPGMCEVREYNIYRNGRNHQFSSLDSFCKFLEDEKNPTNRKIGCGNPVVFIEENRIFADLDYASNRNDYAILPLIYSDEFSALQEFLYPKSVSQKDLWRLLHSKLSEAFNPILLVQVTQLSIDQNLGGEVTIDPTGLINRTGKETNSVQLSIPTKNGPDNVKTFTVDWEFTGPIWECSPLASSIPIRFELDIESGAVLFTAHPKGLSKILQNQRRSLIDHIRETVGDIYLYEANYHDCQNRQ
jgi:hypothetical protein